MQARITLLHDEGDTKGDNRFKIRDADGDETELHSSHNSVVIEMQPGAVLNVGNIKTGAPKTKAKKKAK